MPTEKILFDRYNGITEYVHIDPMQPGKLAFSAEQDCAEIIEQVKRERDRPVGKEWRLVAQVPMIFYDKAMREGWHNDPDKWHEFLNNPDYAAFRVWNGRIGKSKQI
jgi:hypothetical protein